MNQPPSSLSPDQKIDQDLCFVGALLGGWIATILEAWGVIPAYPRAALAGVGIGFLCGAVLGRLRPRYAQAQGFWKKFNEFVLAQLDLEQTFRRWKERNSSPHP